MKRRVTWCFIQIQAVCPRGFKVAKMRIFYCTARVFSYFYPSELALKPLHDSYEIIKLSCLSNGSGPNTKNTKKQSEDCHSRQNLFSPTLLSDFHYVIKTLILLFCSWRRLRISKQLGPVLEAELLGISIRPKLFAQGLQLPKYSTLNSRKVTFIIRPLGEAGVERDKNYQDWSFQVYFYFQLQINAHYNHNHNISRCRKKRLIYYLDIYNGKCY